MFLTMALVAFALGAYLAAESIRERWRRRPRRAGVRPQRFDPGTERRAERRARTLLRSIVNEEEWEMYRDLGFIRVHGSQNRPRGVGESYGYLIYPHKPIVAYLPQTRELLNEYCVEFPDETRPYGSSRLPDSDDVLAKWMALTGDEQHLIATANMHLPGRQVDPKQVRRDLWRLSQWERERLRRTPSSPGGVPAP
jgi:Ni/Co efflux regulator RcnB